MDRHEMRRREEFLGRLREAMNDNEMTQAELARGVDASSATVSDWFSKKALPEGAKMLLLPAVLKTSGHWLLTGRGPRTPPEMDQASSVLHRGIHIALGRMEEFLVKEREVWSATSPASIADDAAAGDHGAHGAGSGGRRASK